MTIALKPLHSALIGGTLCTLCYAYLAVNSQAYGDLGLIPLLLCSFVCALISFFVWWRHWRDGEQVNLLALLGFALLFRLFGMFTFPILEDDFYRYLWDARITFENGSPYGISPATYFDADLSERFELILGSINYPEVPTVYGPVCQWVFALAYLIAPGEVWPLQCIFNLADAMLILVLLKLAKPTHVLLYAWSPLIIKEFAITAHPDVLGALCLMIAVLNYHRSRYLWVGVFVALATGVKVFAIMLLPFLLGFQWRGWLGFLITATLIALPFGLLDAWVPEGLHAMGSDWLFNAPLYAILANWLDIVTIKGLLLGALACGCGAYLLYALTHWPLKTPRADLLFAALFLCLPALNPWYLVWLLPFAVITPSLWAWAASLCVLLSYVSGLNLPASELDSYQHPNWVLVVEFGAILIAAISSFFMRRSKHWLPLGKP